MRLSTFNVENMFDRAKALNLATWAEGKPILDDYKRLNDLIQEDKYTDAIKFYEECVAIQSPYQPLAAGNLKGLKSAYKVIK